MELRTDPQPTMQAWHTVTVEELKAPTDNALATGPFGSSIGSQFFEKQGIPLIRGSNLSNDGHTHLIDDGFVFVSQSKAVEFRRSMVSTGDLVFTCWGTINQVGLISERTAYPRYLISNKQMKFTPDSRKADSLFLFYLFSGPELQRAISDQSIGSSVPGFNLGQLRAMRLRIPPLPEQRAIAGALGEVDALLGALTRLMAKKRDLKKAAMQQLLTGQTRLPGFSGEWVVKRLGEVAEILMGQSPSSSNYNTKGGGLPLIQGNADVENRKTIRRIFTTQITKRGKCGDILMSVRAPVGEIARAAFDVCLGRGVCAIRYANDFMYHYLINQEASWAKLSKGSTFDSVNSADVKALEVRLPTDADEQAAIATLFSDMDAELAALERRLAKTRAVKQGMMQELLTGRTRLV